MLAKAVPQLQLAALQAARAQEIDRAFVAPRVADQPRHVRKRSGDHREFFATTQLVVLPDGQRRELLRLGVGGCDQHLRFIGRRGVCGLQQCSQQNGERCKHEGNRGAKPRFAVVWRDLMASQEIKSQRLAHPHSVPPLLLN